MGLCDNLKRRSTKMVFECNVQCSAVESTHGEEKGRNFIIANSTTGSCWPQPCTTVDDRFEKSTVLATFAKVAKKRALLVG